MSPPARLCLSSLFLSLLPFIAPLGAQTSEENARLDLRYWAPEISGDVQVVEQGVGARIDLESDLGLRDDEFLESRLSFFPGRRHQIRFGFVPISYGGDEVVSRTLEFSGQVFTISERVVSSLDLDYFRFGWAWLFLGSRDGSFRGGPLLEVKGFQGDASLSAPDALVPVSEASDFEAAFGSVGLLVEAKPSHRLHLFAEASVLVGADEGDLLDGEAGLRFLVTRNLSLTAGYRTLQFDVTDDDNLLDFDVEGAFFSGAVSF